MSEQPSTLAQQVANILKDKSISTEDRLKKMKEILPDSIKSKSNIDHDDEDEVNELNVSEQNTYDAKTIKKAAIRNKILNKKKIEERNEPPNKNEGD